MKTNILTDHNVTEDRTVLGTILELRPDAKEYLSVVDDAIRFVSANVKKLEQNKDITIKGDAREVKAGDSDIDEADHTYNTIF